MAEIPMNWGGSGRFLMHRAVVNAGATGYDIKAADGVAAATTAAQATISCEGYLLQSVFSIEELGGKIAITDFDSRSATLAGIKVMSPLTGSGAGATVPAAIVMEHGVSRGGPGGGNSSRLGYWQYYGNLDNKESPADATARWVAWGIGTVDPSSHNVTFSDANYVSRVITINPVKPDYAYAGLTTLIDADYITPVVLPLAQYQSVDYAYMPYVPA